MKLIEIKPPRPKKEKLSKLAMQKKNQFNLNYAYSLPVSPRRKQPFVPAKLSNYLNATGATSDNPTREYHLPLPPVVHHQMHQCKIVRSLKRSYLQLTAEATGKTPERRPRKLISQKKKQFENEYGVSSLSLIKRIRDAQKFDQGSSTVTPAQLRTETSQPFAGISKLRQATSPNSWMKKNTLKNTFRPIIVLSEDDDDEDSTGSSNGCVNVFTPPRPRSHSFTKSIRLSYNTWQSQIVSSSSSSTKSESP